MKSNVLRFPKELTTKSDVKDSSQMSQKDHEELLEESFKLIDQMNDLDLMRLREAFDQARRDWPAEEAELPEKNKIHSL